MTALALFFPVAAVSSVVAFVVLLSGETPRFRATLALLLTAAALTAALLR
ncbi:hypothetical protein [Streptomyces sp. NPDC060198]